MLASREPLEQAPTLLEERFYIEPKLDGERMQLHRQKNTYRYWSRKAKEYTYLYESSLTPYIQNCFSDSIESIILDGEMIAYDPVTDSFQPFGKLKTVALEGFLSSFLYFGIFGLLNISKINK